MFRRPRTELLFAASAGGHLDLLLALAPEVLGDRQALWVTSDSSRGEALRASMSHVELVPEYGRNLRALAANIASAARVIARHRPRTVVTSGAGLIVPLVLFARLTGSRVLYVETMARVSSPSKTGQLLSRLASRVLVQWPELAAKLPRATVCRPVLLDEVPEGVRAEGEGTFVAVGTHEQEFGRMLEIVEEAAANDVLPRPIFAQAGPGERPSDHVEMVEFISAEDLQERINNARVIVSHGGAGIISSALSAGRTPIVVPRRAEFDEHVDDHQYQLARKLQGLNAVVKIETDITSEDVAQAVAPLELPDELHDGVSIAEVLAQETERPGADGPSEPPAAAA